MTEYVFPHIETFSDVEFAIDDKYFITVERDTHKIINYLFVAPDVFPDASTELGAMRREFRGLIFDDVGRIIRRPFHKFFNVGEREETLIKNMNITNRPHLMYDKLDGSMIAPYTDGLSIYWGTKLGHTDVARQAEAFVDRSDINYTHFVCDMLEFNYTPIFEWCSRKQRIVLDYSDDQLILTAIRHMHTGEYMSDFDMRLRADQFNIPVCDTLCKDNVLDDQFLIDSKRQEDVEGYVIRFNDGHMVKIKCDWYVRLHKVKAQIAQERGVVELILNGEIDDLKPLMSEEDLERIEKYEQQFSIAYKAAVNNIKLRLSYNEGERITRKDFALNIAPTLQGYETSIIFRLFDDGADVKESDISSLLSEYIKKNCNRMKSFAIMRETPLFSGVDALQTIYLDE